MVNQIETMNNPSQSLEFFAKAGMVFSACAFTFLTCGACGSANAQDLAESWAQLQEQLGRNKQYVARDIATRYDLPGDDARVIGSYRTTIISTGTDGQPIRALAEQTTQGTTGLKLAPMAFGIAENIANRPYELIATAAPVDIAGQETLDGRRCLIINIAGRFSTKGRFPLNAKIWIGESDSHPIRIEGSIDKISMPGISKIDFRIDYQDSQDGRSLPKQISISYPVKIFFHTGYVAFRHDIAAWTARSR